MARSQEEVKWQSSAAREVSGQQARRRLLGNIGIMNNMENQMNHRIRKQYRATVMAVLIFLGAAVVCNAADTIDTRVGELERKLDAALGMLAEKPSGAEASATHVGGYGEMHYNNLEGEGGASDANSLDFHRFVLFVDHEFSDGIRFVSELEVEHSLAGEGKPGEVELEQAYLDLDINDDHTVRAGLFLIPVGIINRTHEPPTFYGVERNSVEKNIIPSTWWEGGAGVYGNLYKGFSYGAYLHSGLGTSSNSTYAARSGRQKVAKADASEIAGTLALSWSMAGLAVGGAAQYQSDITQGSDSGAGSAWLGELHAEMRRGPIAVRALYGQWEIDGAAPKAMDADRQYGWYIEPSYKPIEKVGVFARYSVWDNQAGSSGTTSERTQIDVGVNWWPHERVVFKADYQLQDNKSGKDQNGVNLGLGYNF